MASSEKSINTYLEIPAERATTELKKPADLAIVENDWEQKHQYVDAQQWGSLAPTA